MAGRLRRAGSPLRSAGGRTQDADCCCEILNCEDWEACLLANGFEIIGASLQADIEVTVAGVANGTNGICNCEDCADINGTYVKTGPIGIGEDCCDTSSVGDQIQCGIEPPDGEGYSVAATFGFDGNACGDFAGYVGGLCAGCSVVDGCDDVGCANFAVTDAAAAMAALCTGATVPIPRTSSANRCLCNFSAATMTIRLVPF